ncbi:putative serine protease PepD [Crossiella equi]|uniref:Serine protease PepD n=1 Tax=Crossiella equi TaxID=130796 RepID=A0ABS5AE73_9PSEU|nr:trypsin-like peptidase domain-containing protein [Crossiella equi]MBP2474898.1 putative serine protease PepD [Crossiella equi]
MTENTPGAPGHQPERPQHTTEGTGAANSDWAPPTAQQDSGAGLGTTPSAPGHGTPGHGAPASGAGTPGSGFGGPTSDSGTPGSDFGAPAPGGQPSGYGGQPAGAPGPSSYSGSGYTPFSTSQAQSGGPGFPPGAPVTNPLGVPVQTVPQQRKAPGRGKLVAGALALVLLGGALGGGVGGVVAYNIAGGQSSSSSSNALNQPKPAAKDINSPAAPGTVEQVAQKVLPSVVQLQVGSGSGSGVVLSSDGMILTNNHVIEAAANGGRITVQFQDGRTASARLIGRDATSDLAVVKADNVSGLTPIELGRSDDLRVGQQVVAIGAPFGLQSTVTSGIVSALNRPVRTGDSQDNSTVMDAVQTDAAINPGNSGGALVDMQGRLIGINSAIRTATASQGQPGGSIGLGFAIPVDQARRIADELIKNGKATHAVLGVNLAPPSRNNTQQVAGATVGEVNAGGGAEAAGIKAGDVITKIDDRRIEDADSLIAAVRSYAPGAKVKLTITTGGGDRVVEATLGSQVLDQQPTPPR